MERPFSINGRSSLSANHFCKLLASSAYLQSVFISATIQQIKKGIQNCKKRKKEATAQIAKLEAEMKERHEKELNDFQEKKSTESSISEKVGYAS